MAQFIHSRVVLDEGLSASEVVTADLGVNGISHLHVSLTALQAADNTLGSMVDMLAVISRLEVLWNGQAIVSGNGRDLATISQILTGWPVIYRHAAEAANAEIGCDFILPFSRVPFWGEEGLPAVRRGELQVQLTAAASFGDVTAPEVEIEQVELPGAALGRGLKYTVLAATPAATGDYDIDLPIGNQILGIQIFTTDEAFNLNETGTVSRFRVLVDNVEYGYAAIEATVAAALANMRGRPSLSEGNHAHISDLAAAYTQYQSTGNEPVVLDPGKLYYCYLDYDPLRDGAYAIDASGLNSLRLRSTIATANEAIRILPVELVAWRG